MEIMHRQFYHPTPPSNQFHHPPSGWYSNPYYHQHQTTPPSFLSCMHETADQPQTWTHPPHHMFQNDWFPDTPSFQNDVKEEHVLSSTPNTISGSEISASPGPPAGSVTDQYNASNNTPRSPYEWMRKSSYQPQPGKCAMTIRYCPVINLTHAKYWSAVT
ncbi:uncharacterized protein LOC103513545 [Diaphorina citri]|uniref:Uncharacterized protein LOC103513545 n=1 Tax=Diaphorina citri TaxID=121845 RepID=A0A1S3D9W8_DIACI|nr:uncharacterized protein LOC103513545 [Diaphorina citri]